MNNIKIKCVGLRKHIDSACEKHKQYSTGRRQNITVTNKFIILENIIKQFSINIIQLNFIIDKSINEFWCKQKIYIYILKKLQHIMDCSKSNCNH